MFTSEKWNYLTSAAIELAKIPSTHWTAAKLNRLLREHPLLNDSHTVHATWNEDLLETLFNMYECQEKFELISSVVNETAIVMAAPRDYTVIRTDVF